MLIFYYKSLKSLSCSKLHCPFITNGLQYHYHCIFSKRYTSEILSKLLSQYCWVLFKKTYWKNEMLLCYTSPCNNDMTDNHHTGNNIQFNCLLFCYCKFHNALIRKQCKKFYLSPPLLCYDGIYNTNIKYYYWGI